MGTTRALVTGGTGFLGHHLVARLQEEGCVVGVTSVPNDPLLDDLPEGVRGFGYDVRDRDATDRALREFRPDAVFHLAALLHSRELATLLSINAGGTDTLLHVAASQVTPPSVVIPGSASEYGVIPVEAPIDETTPLRPISSYGISKAAQSLTGLSYGLRGEVSVVVGRIFNMAGPGEPETMLCGAMASQIAAMEAHAHGGELRVGNLTPYRDYSDVRDVVDALWHLYRAGESGSAYNISSGVPRQVEQIVTAMADLSRVPVALTPDPARQRPSDVPFCCGSAERLRSATGWVPAYGLSETLEATLDYWRDRHTPRAAVG